MNKRESTGDSFEERLLAYLNSERNLAEEAFPSELAATPIKSHRGPRLAVGAVAGVASMAAVIAIGVGGSDSHTAYAVEPRADGEVRVEIRSLEDAKGLENALSQAGIPASVNYLAPGTACEEPRFTPAPWPGDARAIVIGPGVGEGPFVFSINGAKVDPDQTLVITASGNLVSQTRVELAAGPVAPCTPYVVAPV